MATQTSPGRAFYEDQIRFCETKNIWSVSQLP